MTSDIVRIAVIDPSVFGSGREAGSDMLDACLALRRTVFCDEQGVSEGLEFDGCDAEALHLACLLDDHVVGTLRLVCQGDQARLGRMAVRADCRRAGIGRRLVQAASDLLVERGCTRIVLHAQVRALGFYEALGFRARGERFTEAAIEHVFMDRDLAPRSSQSRSD